MKRRFHFSIFLFLSLLCCCFAGFAQDIKFDLVPPPIGFPGIITKAMTQDAQGYLWLATNDGLYKYDGYQYTAYHHEPLNANTPGAASNEWIIADKAGNIWEALYYSGLDRLDPVTGIFTHFHNHPGDAGSLINDTVLGQQNHYLPKTAGTSFKYHFIGYLMSVPANTV